MVNRTSMVAIIIVTIILSGVALNQFRKPGHLNRALSSSVSTGTGITTPTRTSPTSPNPSHMDPATTPSTTGSSPTAQPPASPSPVSNPSTSTQPPAVNPPTPTLTQGISGNISYGPMAPACRLLNETLPPPSFQFDHLIIESQTGVHVDVPVAWRPYYGCELSGSFRVQLEPDMYMIDFSTCASEPARTFGCLSLPIAVTVLPGATASVNISIYTGIA